MVVVTSPIGVQAPPAFAAITTTAPKILPSKTMIEDKRELCKKLSSFYILSVESKVSQMYSACLRILPKKKDN